MAFSGGHRLPLCLLLLLVQSDMLIHRRRSSSSSSSYKLLLPWSLNSVHMCFLSCCAFFGISTSVSQRIRGQTGSWMDVRLLQHGCFKPVLLRRACNVQENDTSQDVRRIEPADGTIPVQPCICHCIRSEQRSTTGDPKGLQS